MEQEPKEIRITLPLAPSVNNVWVGRGLGKGYALKPHVKRYREEVRLIWLQSGRPHLEGRLYMRIDVFTRDKRKRDLDNFGKATLDSMQKAGFFDDDEQIDELHIIRRGIQPPGALQIYLREITN